MSYLVEIDKGLWAAVRSAWPTPCAGKRSCLFSMHSIESLWNQRLADETLAFDAILSTKTVGNSCIRPARAQKTRADASILLHQGLSMHMDGLNTLLSTESVHSELKWKNSIPSGRKGYQARRSCSKMTRGNVVAVNQGLSAGSGTLRTILSTQSVHKAAA